MTRRLLSAAAMFLTSLPLLAGQNVRLSIEPRLGGERFAFHTEVSAPDGGYVFQVTMLRYYLTRITIVHDGGQRTLCGDVVLLVNLNDPQVFDLGSYEVTSVEGIEFGVGVNQIHNHLDPSTYPPGHPLGHQDPSMHWGWTTGYRFCTFEGKAATTNSSSGNIFQIHTVGDNLYTTVGVTANAANTESGLVIPLVAEYANLLTNINVSLGAITHGDFGEAVILMQNFKDHVFTPGTVSSVEESEPRQHQDGCVGTTSPLHLSPNPASHSVHYFDDAWLDASGKGLTTRIIMINNIGEIVRTISNAPEELDLDVSGLPNGVYNVVAERANGRRNITQLIKQ